MLNAVLIVVGLVLVIWGADIMTKGAVGVANRLGVPQIVIGLTIVAMGTSAPELFVSLMSAFSGSSDLAVGNILGSNVFNTLAIVGASALAAPLLLTRNTIHKDLPIAVAASAILLFLSLDGTISRLDAAILFAAFLCFLAYTLRIAKNGTGEEDTDGTEEDLPTWKSVLFIVLGLACLVFGSNIFVSGATGVAQALGVSDAIIGLTIVACGTSLPELATSIVAARKGNSGIAIGNVIGSNVFNILMILGITGIACPMTVKGVTMVDFAVVLGSGLLMWLFCATKRTVERWEGFILLATYIAYVAYLIMSI